MTQRSLLRPPSESAAPRAPLLAKGFRPFFLMAGAFAVLALPAWLVFFALAVDAAPYFGPMYWHAHEMVFGYSVAVLAGFLLTATSNWTSRETAVGPLLAVLALLWLGGRVAILVGHLLPSGLAAAIDLAFLPALALACGRPMIATGNRRNFAFLGLLSALWLANAGVHLGALGVRPEWLRSGSLLGVNLTLIAIVLMGGRVIPMFTRNATGVTEIKNSPRLDRLAVASMLAYTLADALLVDARPIAIFAALAGIATAIRMRTWGSRHTLSQPLLWVLHVGHAFVPLGLFLRALSLTTTWAPSSSALHALTAGAIGVMTLGMMTRVSLGHTGRMLAVPRPVAAAFGLVIAGALVRVGAPFGPASLYILLVTVAGVIWALGFLIFVVIYAPALTSARADGRPG